MRKFFAKGLIALLPLVLTAVVLYFAVGFLYNNIGTPIGQALKWGAIRFLGWTTLSPEHAWFFEWGAPFLGFAVGIVLTLIVGFFVATFLGKTLYRYFERLITKLPIVRTVYPYAKQFTDFFFSRDEKKQDFKSVVACPFPSPGMYSIGFVTSEGMRSLNEATHHQLVCVFVPAAPTPFSGFIVYVPRENVIPLPITVEEAMRIVISAGVLHPSHQAISPSQLIPIGNHPPIPDEQLKALEKIREGKP
jgi:uncharacterized membrane protein